jgi:hypothetical protein
MTWSSYTITFVLLTQKEKGHTGKIKHKSTTQRGENTPTQTIRNEGGEREQLASLKKFWVVVVVVVTESDEKNKKERKDNKEIN